MNSKMIVAVVGLALVFLLFDLLWLGIIARDFYRAALSGLLADSINLPAAIAFYLLYTFGVAVFVLAPALDSGSVQKALVLGALFGLVAYGTYDLTNLAVAKGFPIKMAVVDMVWGTVLTATSAAAATWLALTLAK